MNPGPKERDALMRRYGDFALAYSAARQPGLSYLGDGRGVLAYVTVGRSALVLSNPLAPPELWGELTRALVDEKGDVSFWQVSRPVAERLADLGFSVNEIGTEWRLDLETYSFAGPKKRNFRTARRRAEALGLRTLEAPVDEVDRAELARVSDEWRNTRAVKTRELSFLVRPVVLAPEEDVRKFFTLGPDGRPVAFASFDPVFDAGTLVGYLLATRRRLPSTDPLIGYELVRAAVETFRAEGLKWLLLGLAPGQGVKDREFRADWTTSQCVHFIRENGLFQRYVYPIQGLIKHKHSFLGQGQTSYCATNRWPGGFRFFRAGRASGLL